MILQIQLDFFQKPTKNLEEHGVIFAKVIKNTLILNFISVREQQNIFEIIMQNLVAHILTLLLAPFASKLVNYSWHSEFLNFRKNSKLT